MNQETFANQINQLRTTLGKMELALGTVDEAIVWTDTQGRVQWCNTAFDRLVGQLHILILGKQLTTLLPLKQAGKNIPAFDYPFFIALETQTKSQGCYEFQQNSQDLNLEISASPFRFQDSGQPEKWETSVVLVIRDVTESKRTEQALLQAKEDLEQRVIERTHELIVSNEQLELQSQRTHLFAELTLKIRESLQIDEVLQNSVTEVQKLLKADRVLTVWKKYWIC